LKLAQYTGLQVNHPYIKEVVNQIENKKPLYQSLNNMLELPFKFSTKDKEATSAFYDAIDRKTKENARADDKIKPIYQHVQELKDAGKTEDAQAIVNGLSDAEYESYKRIRTNDRTKTAKGAEAKIFPVVLQVKARIDAGDQAGAEAIVNGLSDDDYKAYKAAKNRLPPSEQF
jgi:hypothetical protein